MRNLQKILALVLALVMSLSLMATAGATDFTDGDSITDTFAESVKVLDGLKVFQGYPEGDFRPQGEITRAEVAAIIYRIATGDVGDTQVGIYADYDVFNDVYASEPISGWAAGYINYCANAEYVKGRGNGKFDPAGKVTGYEALAMILRAVGYDKNGEFTGADWQVQTAAIANQRKVTQNINAGMLGQPATREMVAEILCKAILLNKVNYTLAYGYQISTNDQDTIAYDTFQMECLTGVVTGNEIADLENSSPMAASQTRMVVDGEEKVLNFATGLDSIGKSVRAYIRPQGGTTVKELVSGETFDTELNHVYDSFAPVSSVGNSTGSEQGINSIVGAEHFVNYDFVNRWTAAIRITYIMDMQWTEYQAKTMLLENGGRLFDYVKRADAMDPSKPSQHEAKASQVSTWATQLTTNADYTYTYTKTIALDEMLTNQDYNNLLSIFTNADKTGNPGTWITGEVYVGTASFNIQDDISDDIRWTDFVNTYLVNKDNRAQVESNGRGNRLIIIDNDDDGIAEYVLQTIYTIAKVSSDVKNVDVINTKLYDSSNSDAVNSTTTSNTLVSVSGKELAKSEDALAAGDVVIYALIDGNIRAQKAETKTEKVNTVNRAGQTITVTGEEAATYNESAVHTHSSGLTSGVNGMAGNTNYTMYFDLDGNMAAYTEGANGGLVLITNGWHRSAIGGAEYAVQAYLDGSLQTVEVGASGAQFINRNNSNNNWNQLRYDFGQKVVNGETVYTINNENKSNPTGIHTIIANLDGNTLTPVDLAYFYSQNLRMLDMRDKAIPGINNVTKSWGTPYTTVGQPYTGNGVNTYPAYNVADTNGTGTDGTYEVRGLTNTVYYVVYKGIGTDTMTNGQNVVVRQYTGSAPSVPADKIEDVYAVGAKATTATGLTYYTAQMVVIEVNGTYNRVSEQVFIPDFAQVSGNVGIEDVTMIRENGEKVTVKVDMYNSYTYDWYNTAEDTTINAGSRTRLPGLYFMDPSDTDPSVYVVQKMSPTEIRDSNYLVGYVEESVSGNNGTLISRYPQIELKVRPDAYKNNRWVAEFGSNADVATAAATRPLNPGGTDNKVDARYQGKNLTDDSKLYTYGGSTATLEESNAYEVFAQYRHDDAGTTVSGLNERWDGNTVPTVINGQNVYNFSEGVLNQGNRNEVVVRYNGSGNIIWAVSFNETSNKYAQKVWWNLLPIDADADTRDTEWPTLTVPGAEADTTVDIDSVVTPTVSGNTKTYNIPRANWNEWTGDEYVVTPHAGNKIALNNNVLATNNLVVAANVVAGTTQTITVLSQGEKNGAPIITYTFVLNYVRGSGNKALTIDGTTITAGDTYFDTSDATGRTLLAPPTNATNPIDETIQTYIEHFNIPEGAQVKWDFEAGASKATVYSIKGNWNVTNVSNDFGFTTRNLTKVTATVTAGDGTTAVYSSDTSALKTVTYTASGSEIVEYLDADGTTWKTLTSISAPAGTKLSIRYKNAGTTITGGRFKVGTGSELFYTDADGVAEITVPAAATSAVTFESYSTILGYITLSKAAAPYDTHIGTVAKVGSIAGSGRQLIGTVVVDNNWTLHTNVTGVELVAGTAGATTTTWNVYADVDKITSATNVTDLYVTAVPAEGSADPDALIPSDSAYSQNAAGQTVVTITGTTKNNLDEFNAKHENIMGTPANYNKDAVAATCVNLQKAVTDVKYQANGAYTFRIIQTNKALGDYYSSDPNYVAPNTKDKSGYTWEQLEEFCLMLESGNGANFDIYVLPYEAVPGTSPVEYVHFTLVVTNNATITAK